MYHGNIYRVFFIFDEGRIVVYGVDLSTLNKKRTDNQCVLFFVEMTGILTSLEALDLYCFSFCQFYQ